jgi:hypothetical protein
MFRSLKVREKKATSEPAKRNDKVKRTMTRKTKTPSAGDMASK